MPVTADTAVAALRAVRQRLAAAAPAFRALNAADDLAASSALAAGLPMTEEGEDAGQTQAGRATPGMIEIQRTGEVVKALGVHWHNLLGECDDVDDGARAEGGLAGSPRGYASCRPRRSATLLQPTPMRWRELRAPEADAFPGLAIPVTGAGGAGRARRTSACGALTTAAVIHNHADAALDALARRR
jgi:hypothetical protein